MAATSPFLAKKRHAVVTGANKGIGLEVCRQLAVHGVHVILTSRDKTRGSEAVENLKKSGTNSENLEFNQLDVTDPASVASLVDFIKNKFGMLDILVNNAGILGATANYDALVAAGFPDKPIDYAGKVTQTFEQAEECLEANYYGVKRLIEALFPLLQLSDSPRIVNVSSSSGKLRNIPSQQIREVLSNAENLTEERVDELLTEFMRDFKNESLTEKGWPSHFSAYIMTKAALNAYTRILSNKHPSFLINCLCPGFVKSDINQNTGYLTVEEGGASIVKLAFLPEGAPSGLFYYRDEIASVE